MTNRLHSSGIAALSFTLSAGVLALALTPAVASAATGSSDPVEFTVTGERLVATKRVTTADLDLNDSKDLKRLDARIRGAVEQVCVDHGDGRMTVSENLCRADARRSANQQLAALRGEALALASGGDSGPSSTIAVVAAR